MRYQHKASRAGRGAARAEDYNTLKSNWTVIIAALAREATTRSDRLPAAGRVTVQMAWTEPDRGRDPDGVAAGGAKLVFDGLVAAGVLSGDGARHVGGLSHHFYYEGAVGVSVFLDWHPEGGLMSAWHFRVPHRLPDLNELLAARELGARRSVAAAARRARR